jgi:hypothetical protein
MWGYIWQIRSIWFYITRNYAKKCIKIITNVAAYQTVKLNGNEPISCVAVITFTAALSLKITLKVVYTISIFVNSVWKSSRRLNSDYCQTRQHKTDHLTPDSARHERLHFLLPECPVTKLSLLSILVSHRTNGALVQKSMLDTGYKIGYSTVKF